MLSKKLATGPVVPGATTVVPQVAVTLTFRGALESDSTKAMRASTKSECPGCALRADKGRLAGGVLDGTEILACCRNPIK